MNPNLDTILSRLQKVRGRNGNYVACCPAHDDRSPSMTIRDVDGKILMHCFSGCSIHDIAGAIGIDLSDLFPPETKTPDYNQPQRPVRPRFLASDLLKVVAFEATLVAVAAHDMAKGRALSPEDKERLLLAQRRINEALEANQ